MPRIIRDMFGDLPSWGRFWLSLGIASLVAAALMSWDFGYSISFKHGAFLACLTVVTAFLPDAAYTQWETTRKGVGIALAILCVPLFLVEFYSHAGYTAGLRGANVSDAKVQNARYDHAQEATKEDKANLEMWKAQLARLMEQDGWVATIKAEALRAELGTVKERMTAEEAGKRGRKAGRGKEFEALQNKSNDLAARIAKVEQREDLTKRIEATQRILDRKREVANATEHKSSAVAHQKDWFARAVSFAGFGKTKPSEMVEEGVDHTVNVAMAFIGTVLPALALFVAGLYRRRSEMPHRAEGVSYATEAKPAPSPLAPLASLAPVILNAVAPPRVDTTALARRIVGNTTPLLRTA